MGNNIRKRNKTKKQKDVKLKGQENFTPNPKAWNPQFSSNVNKKIIANAYNDFIIDNYRAKKTLKESCSSWKRTHQLLKIINLNNFLESLDG